MRRHVFNVLGSLSLALCVGVGLLGVRNIFRGDHLAYSWLQAQGPEIHGGNLVALYSKRGGFVMEVTCVRTAPGIYLLKSSPIFAPIPDGHLYWDSYPARVDALPYGNFLGRVGDWLGFTYAYWNNFLPIYFDTQSMTLVIVPIWFPMLLFALLPALRLRRYLLDRQRHRPGFCRQCGYDLRATPLRCPECGTPPAVVALLSGR
ncbi:MAG TPA: hypothetical protein VIL86_17030 [Tepidisphaeraceae bacterium]|jgi:hypothetical protein